MKSATLSRGPDVDTDKCVNNIGNRYDMIIIAAARAQEIRRMNRNSQRRDHAFPIVTALLEIESGVTGKDYFEKLAAQRPKIKQ